MSDFFHVPTKPKAAKDHQCIACFGVIAKGETHYHQTGFYEGKATRNRYHNECWDSLSEDGEFEFMPGQLDQPERLTGERTQ